MGKITLEFDSIEESGEAKDAMDGTLWKLVAWDMDQYFREKLKYATLPDEVYDAFEKAREELRDIIANYNLVLDM
jgi:hypothetical protein